MQKQTQRTGGCSDYKTDDDTEAVIDRYSSMVYKIALTHMRSEPDAEDIFQEVFLRYVKNTKKFVSEEHRKAWLIRVTVNCCKKAYLAPWNDNISLEDVGEIADESNEKNKEILKEILKLPMQLKTVVLLFYYENMSVGEIAKALRTTEAAVKMRLSRARKLLRLELESGNEKHEPEAEKNGDDR